MSSSLPSFASVSLSLSLIHPQDSVAVLDTLVRFHYDMMANRVAAPDSYLFPRGAMADVLRLIGHPEEASSSLSHQMVVAEAWLNQILLHPMGPAATVPDCVAHANAVIAMMNEVLTANGLSQVGWLGTLDSSTTHYSRISYPDKEVSLSKYYIRKANVDILRDTVLMDVAKILVVGTSDSPLSKAHEIGWKNLPRPSRILDAGELRWQLICPCCDKRRYKNVLTKRTRKLQCRDGGHEAATYKVFRNPLFSQNVVRLAEGGGGRQKRKKMRWFEEDDDGYLSGAPPECYDSDGAYLGGEW